MNEEVDENAGADAGNGGEEAPWYNGVSDENKGFFENKSFDSLDTFAKSYKNLESMRGIPEGELLRIAKSDDAEAMAKMHERLGRPADGDGYGLEDANKWAAEHALKAGLSPAQLNSMLEGAAAHDAANATKAEEQRNIDVDHDVAELKKQWGQAYDANMDVATQAATQFGVTPEMLDSLENVMGTKATLEFMQRIGASVGEGSFAEGGSEHARHAAGHKAMSPEQASAARDQLVNDPEWQKRVFSNHKPTRVAALAERTKLSELAYA